MKISQVQKKLLKKIWNKNTPTEEAERLAESIKFTYANGKIETYLDRVDREMNKK
jgi:hypothetical protein